MFRDVVKLNRRNPSVKSSHDSQTADSHSCWSTVIIKNNI